MAGRKKKQFVVRPSDGGALITEFSEEIPGNSNYTVKQNWKRDEEAEIVREGWDAYDGRAPLPEDVNLLFQMRDASERAWIACTPTKVYRLFDDGWQVIGSGYTDSGRPWEAEVINGMAVFNNGVDAPQMYRLSWVDDSMTLDSGWPLGSPGFTGIELPAGYEIESLILSNEGEGDAFDITVGLITGDGEIATKAHLPSGWSSVIDRSENPFQITHRRNAGVYIMAAYGVTSAGYDPYGIEVTVNLNRWLVGLQPIWELRELGTISVGTIGSYQGFLMAGNITDLDAEEITSFFNDSADPYGPVGSVDSDILVKTPYRVQWASVMDPDRWPLMLHASVGAGSRYASLEFPTRSIRAGDRINFRNLTDELVCGTLADGQVLVLATEAGETLSAQILTLVDHASLTSDYDDVYIGGSSVVRIAPLRSQVVVYLSEGIAVGQTTGSITTPIVMSHSYEGTESIEYPWSLVIVEDLYHLYAGKDRIYRFDINNRRPVVEAPFEQTKRTFVENSQGYDVNGVIGLLNTLEKEVWWGLPGGITIAFDYNYTTISTIDATIYAGSVGEIADNEWRFLLSDGGGRVCVYAKDESGSQIWQRNGTDYTAVIQSGLYNVGREFKAAILRLFGVAISSHSYVQDILVELYKTYSLAASRTPHCSRTITLPDQNPVLPVHIRDIYVQDRIEVVPTGPVRLSSRLFEYLETNDRPIRQL